VQVVQVSFLREGDGEKIVIVVNPANRPVELGAE
jgi:hypothetical protein